MTRALSLSTVLLIAHVATATEISSPTTRARSTLAFFSPGKLSSSPLSAPTRMHSNGVSCASMAYISGHRQFHQLAPLHAIIDERAPETNTVERLELNLQFERWRFFQRLLDGELPASDVEDVLLAALRAYLQYGPTATSSENKNENGGNASPVLTKKQRSVMEKLIDSMLSVSDGIGESRFLHMLVLPPVDYESIDIDVDVTTTEVDNMVALDPNALSILEQIEQTLPDPDDEEEAYTSAWDVIIDLYGRESVKVKEEALQMEKEGGSGVNRSNTLECCAESLQWRTLCTIGRVLIHFDFLTKGVLQEGSFQEA